MVYYGAPSKGCQRCRRRKVKCDQRKPGCSNCKRSKTECPGYRDLGEVLFRDEGDRIIRRARKVPKAASSTARAQLPLAAGFSPSTPSSNSLAFPDSGPTPVVLSVTQRCAPVTIYSPLTASSSDLGAAFFFSKYSLREPPFYDAYHSWLSKSYLDAMSPRQSRVHPGFRAAVEAVGLAGISNVYHAPHVADASKAQYRIALAAVNQILQDPSQAVEDTTLILVILLILFETITFDEVRHYRSREAHIKGATALLVLRGRQQFNRERGAQLYVQTRSHILGACARQAISVPAGIVQTACHFENSTIRQFWRTNQVSSPASICEISFRAINLRATSLRYLKDNNDRNNFVEDSDVLKRIRDTALAIDADLQAWKKITVPKWWYTSWDVPLQDPSSPSGGKAGAGEKASGFNGKIHHYHSLWVAEVWNNWRTVRIMVNQIIVNTEEAAGLSGIAQIKSAALTVVREMSKDICISADSFMDNPRIISLHEPLYLVASEENNPLSMRTYAIEKLLYIAEYLGVQQARILAQEVTSTLRKSDA
ncbi:hypothetical protein BX600DRAFT_63442 [Xylariales sp. PMI_506]|nr:hypothetical protein BX600DRAFT_63442 [Xylariales sp. PMI_506]